MRENGCHGSLNWPDARVTAQLGRTIGVTASGEDSVQLVERFIRAENEHDIEAMDTLFAPDASFWANGSQLTDSWAAYRPIMAATLAAFPDGHRERLLTVADRDLVAFRWRITGTHREVWAGVPASGNPVEFNGTSWVRIKDGRIAEAWFDMDLAGPLRQLTSEA